MSLGFGERQGGGAGLFFWGREREEEMEAVVLPAAKRMAPVRLDGGSARQRIEKCGERMFFPPASMAIAFPWNTNKIIQTYTD